MKSGLKYNKVISFKSLVKRIFYREIVINKANLFIIGAQKCGTSTLYDNLIKHKNIHGGRVKEKNFFSYEHHCQRNLDWYHNLFPKKSVIFYKSSKKHYFLDASPSYLSLKHAADKISKYNPEAKFIVMMRNPVDRAFSAWNMYRQMNLLKIDEKKVLFENHVNENVSKRDEQFVNLINLEKFPSFEEMVQGELSNISDYSDVPGILSRGIYHAQIEYYLSLFKPNQFFFICTEEFKHSKTQILSELMHFLELKNNLPKEKLTDTHIRNYEQKMSPETRSKLLKFYVPHNEKLYALLNKKYKWDEDICLSNTDVIIK